MVEHNLAKVGVAGPSPVFRSSVPFVLVYGFTGRHLFRSYRGLFEGVSVLFQIYGIYISTMNYYIRYFDNETLVYDIEDVLMFLEDIPEIDLTPAMKSEIREYAASDNGFPKRVKVRPRVYFIIIKTEAANMQDFKDKKALRPVSAADTKAREAMVLNATREGWYEGVMDFKRVVINHLGKCEYRDTTFKARVKAKSAMDCYNKITDHLSHRVDPRSQFPSCKGKNFRYEFLGKAK